MLDADVDTLLVQPEVAVRAIAARFREDGYTLRTFSVIDRYIETAPRKVDGLTGREARVVIRIWADPAAGRRTRVSTEAVYERIVDPSRLRRDREALVRYDHPTRRYLRRMLGELRERPTP